MVPGTGQLRTFRVTNYLPYNPHFDLRRTFTHLIPPQDTQQPRVNMHHQILTLAAHGTTTTAPDQVQTRRSTTQSDHSVMPNLSTQTQSTAQTASRPRQKIALPPKSVAQARKAPDYALWQRAYEAEQQVYESLGTFSYLSSSSIPAGSLVPDAVIRFTHKYAKDGAVISRKVRFTYPGNRMIPFVHYDPMIPQRTPQTGPPLDSCYP
eukprot:IDg3832t1